jgi:hypothetical protein
MSAPIEQVRLMLEYTADRPQALPLCVQIEQYDLHPGRRAGSIKGDVKKKHFARAAGGYFSDIQPLLAAAIGLARAWFSFSSRWEVLGVIFIRVLRFGFLALASSGLAMANHGSIRDSWPMALWGCPRGHTVALETVCLNPPRILTLEPERSVGRWIPR